MKVFIQNKETGLFLGRNETWVASEAEAENFTMVLLAMDRISLRHLQNVQILMRVTAETYDILVPVRY